MKYPPSSIHIQTDSMVYSDDSSHDEERWVDTKISSDHAPRPTRRSPSSDKNDARWVALLLTNTNSANNNSLHSPMRPRRCLELRWDSVVDKTPANNNSLHSPMRPMRCLELRWDSVVDKTTAVSPKVPSRGASFEELRQYTSSKPPMLATTDPL